MADWREPENYLSRVSKDRIIAAVTEAVSADLSDLMRDLKKAQLVQKADEELRLALAAGMSPGRLMLNPDRRFKADCAARLGRQLIGIEARMCSALFSINRKLSCMACSRLNSEVDYGRYQYDARRA